MKKFLVVLLALLLISGCALVPKPKPRPGKIVVYRAGEDLTMDEIRVSSGIGAIIDRAMLTTVDFPYGQIAHIEAYLYDTNGQQMDVPVEVTVEGNTTRYDTMIKVPGTAGADGYLYGITPGSGTVHFSAAGITYDLPANVYSTWKDLDQNTGLVVGESGVYVSTVEEECFVWNSTTNKKDITLKGQSYLLGEHSGQWFNCLDFINAKAVSQDSISGGEIDRPLECNKYFISQVTGGYVKLFYYDEPTVEYMHVIIFEFSPDGNFL